jgi:glycerol-3-phosphate dehydrogenase
VHISLSKATFGLEHAVYFEVGDGRMVFAIPKFDNVYVGTTDTFYTQEKSNPSIDKADVQYILDAINRNFEQTKLTFADVKGAWAGLRPLVKEEGKGETEISRKDEIFVTESKLIAIAGGKLTGYRKMAEKVVDLVVKSLDMNAIACRTETMCLLGFETQHESVFIHYAAERGMQKLDAERMYHWFGKQAYTVLEYPSVQNLPDFLGKSLSYSFENEMITNPLDFLIHRTQIPYFDLELSLKYLPFVTNYLAKKEVPNLREEMYYIEKLHFLAAFKN